MDTCPPPPAVATFGDALGFAFELVERHRCGQFVAVTGPDHRLVRLTARLAGSRPDLTVDLVGDGPAAARLLHQVTGGRGGLLAISATDRFVPFSPADLGIYRRLRARLSEHRIVLRDWIRTDGDLYQSAAWATHPTTAWPHDPPGERSAEHGADPGATPRVAPAPPA